MIELIPQPKQILELGGALQAADLVLRFVDAEEAETAAFGPAAADPAAVFLECCEEMLEIPTRERRAGQALEVELQLVSQTGDPSGQRSVESYALSVEAGIVITSRSRRGLIYGLHALFAIMRFEGNDIVVPRCRIEDWPDFDMRGLQDDPARGQTSTVDNYKRMVRELSRLRFNLFTFHTEDMMRFDRYPSIGRDGGALTKSQWRELVKYGRRWGVELFLTFQTFGHAQKVTSMPEFRKYSDSPDKGVHYSPAVPEVYDFLEELFEEIHEVFGGDTIHIGCDEVDLTIPGLRSAAMVEDRGAAAVYVDHVRKVAERARKYWSRILFFCEFADGRYNLPLRGSMEDVRTLHKAGLSFVNWNYYDHRWEDYFHFINSLNRCGVDQIIAPGAWTWRQLFPDYLETRRTLPLFTQIGFREGVRDSITCAWNDKSDCFRELHYLNYAVAAEHQWTAGELRDEAGPFAARWVSQFFGAGTPAVVAEAFLWLGDLNGHAYRAARHDFRFPRDWDSRVSVAHTLFWSHPVPGSGTDEDRRESAKMVEEARSLLEQVVVASDGVARNGSVVELLAYELRRAIWLFESVLFNASPGTDEATRLAASLAELKEQFAAHWRRTNIIEGLEEVELRFDTLHDSYEKESLELTEWDGIWGPLKRPKDRAGAE